MTTSPDYRATFDCCKVFELLDTSFLGCGLLKSEKSTSRGRNPLVIWAPSLVPEMQTLLSF
jgi:hypothetical protein